MKIIFSNKIVFAVFACFAAAFAVACTGSDKVEVGIAKTPTEAYKMLFTAVKSKDPEKIKMMLSKNTMGLAEFAASQQKKSIEEVVKNGFTETTFAETMPKMRDEQIKDTFASVEVFNAKSNKWEVIPFIQEDGGWKAAFGDMFKGNWQSPGKPQSVVEQENANAANPNLVPLNNSNVNMENVKPIKVMPDQGNIKKGPNPTLTNTANANPANVNTAQVPPEKK